MCLQNNVDKSFLQSETQERKVFKMIFRMKTFPPLHDRKSQIPRAKTLKCCLNLKCLNIALGILFDEICGSLKKMREADIS